jgi:L-seryl-tRNA(Ser) seleniumtransferase
MLKSLPSVDQILLSPEVSELLGLYSRDMVVEWARAAVDELREELQEGAELPLGDDGKIESGLVAERVRSKAEKLLAPSLKRVVNATGIVIHTNLGRSPLSDNLMQAIKGVLGAYSNLEYDLEAAERGSRHAHLEKLIRALTGAEAGFVVNNNAAAVLVALNTLAAGREVAVSRGELIEIGGSFRIPDIIASGGARIREVGTTNKTKISDYEKVISPDTALLLKVHTSNYKIVGFTQDASVSELVELGRKNGLPVMVDLGSGLFMDLEKHGIEGEKPVRRYVEAGADVITFSGDKLLGGPQAGFIVGKSDIIERIKQNPMVRALRVGKLTIAALEATMAAYLSPESLTEKIPTLKLLLRSSDEIRNAARRLSRELKKKLPQAELKVEQDEAFAGGGSLPASPLPTFVVSIEVPDMSAEDLARAFRSAEVPVIGRLRSGRFCLDCRTILPGDHSIICSAAEKIIAQR